MMNRWLTVCVCLVLFALGWAQTEPAPSTPATKSEQAFKALLEECNGKQRTTRAQADRREVFESYAEKFLEHAKEHSTDESAVTALIVVLELNPRRDSDAHKAALEKLKKDYG